MGTTGATHRPGAPTPGALARQEAFARALATYANLPVDSPYLPALVAMVGALILPALDVLEHGYGDLEIPIAGHWPQIIRRAKSDRIEPPPRDRKAAS